MLFFLSSFPLFLQYGTFILWKSRLERTAGHAHTRADTWRRLLFIDTLRYKTKREALTPVSVHRRRYRRPRGEAFHRRWQENKGVSCSRCLFALFFLPLSMSDTADVSNVTSRRVSTGCRRLRCPSSLADSCCALLCTTAAFHITGVIIGSTFEHSIAAFFLTQLQRQYTPVISVSVNFHRWQLCVLVSY